MLSNRNLTQNSNNPANCAASKQTRQGRLPVAKHNADGGAIIGGRMTRDEIRNEHAEVLAEIDAELAEGFISEEAANYSYADANRTARNAYAQAGAL